MTLIKNISKQCILLLSLIALAPLHTATDNRAEIKKRGRDEASASAIAEAEPVADQIATAIRTNDMAKLTALCEQAGIDLNAIKIEHSLNGSTSKLYSPLGIATAEDNAEAIKILCAHGALAQPEEPYLDGIATATPFFIAFQYGKTTALKALCNYAKAAINTPAKPINPLHKDNPLYKRTLLSLLLTVETPEAEQITLIDLIKMFHATGAYSDTAADEIINNKTFSNSKRTELLALLMSPEAAYQLGCKAIMKKMLALDVSAQDFDFLRTYIDEKGRSTYISTDEDRLIPLFAYVDNILTSLLIASRPTAMTVETFDLFIAQVKAFLATPVTNATGSSMATKAYLTQRGREWEELEAQGFRPADLACITVIPDPSKISAHIIPIPALKQNAQMAAASYKDASSEWNESCGFYAIFHLVNMWQYKSKPIEFIQRLGRSHFSEFLGLMRSAPDLIPALRTPDAIKHTLLLDSDKLSLKHTTYPAAIKHLATSAAIPLGGTSDEECNAIIASYSFLNGVTDQVLQYAPCVNTSIFTDIPRVDGLKFSLTYCNANGDHTKSHTDYLKAAIARSEAFVFPVLIRTTAHASSALIYKATDIPGQAKQFYVFFAESNHMPGHQDSGSSDKAECFDFATCFQQLFATLTDTTRAEIAILGPKEKCHKPHVYTLLEHCEKQITTPEQVYAWRCPSEIITRIEAAIKDSDIPQLDQLCTRAEEDGLDLTTISIKHDIPGAKARRDTTYSPLGIAILEDNAPAIEILCAHGAKTCLCGPLPNTLNKLDAFFLAIYHYKCNALQALCMHAKTEINTQMVYHTGQLISPLAYLMVLKPVSEIAEEQEQMIIAMAKALLDNGANITTTYYLNQETLFHFAIKKRYFELFKMLCTYPQARDAINMLNDTWQIPLVMLANDRTIDNNRRYQLVKMALEAGANPSIKSSMGRNIFGMIEAPEEGYGPYEPRLIDLLKSHAI
ncbi:ankyrin repeat domain-containing protein [Candidatus Dependentiae bacterium]|nr:ankyrin repeat domain-containing protein [Candidatus Dependentiae bacterium]